MKNLNPFLFLFLLTSALLNSQAPPPPPCGQTNEGPPPAIPTSCDLSTISQKCVKLKFHFLEDDPNDPNFPLSYYISLLNQANELFAESGSEICFTPGDNCIHEVDWNGGDLDDLWDMVNAGDPLLELDPTGVDIFMRPGISRPGERGLGVNSYIYFGPNDSEFAHELGHALGLYHTFANNGASVNHECKDGTECAIRGDYICDTGLDPFQETANDYGPWSNYVNGCSQIASSTQPDLCGDNTTPWDIPIDNMMSYYDCGEVLTPCQITFMHDNMTSGDAAIQVIDCSDDPFNFASCPDIIIDTDVTWANQTRELCPGQKIVITETGVLRLENTTLTQGSNVVGCPDFYHELAKWDGIYIEGGNPIHSSTPIGGGPTTVGPIGALIANNSTIEYSNNGIQAPSQFGEVRLNNVIMSHNGTAIKTFENRQHGSTGAGSSFGGRVYVLNSTISVDEGLLTWDKHISIVGSPCMVKATTLTNNSPANDLIGIYSMDGTLSVIEGSKVENFDIGVYKDVDGLSSSAQRGAFILDSELKDCDHVLYNYSEFLKCTGNLLEGGVVSEGLCYGEFTGNHVIKVPSRTKSVSVVIDNPQESFMIEENKFTDATLTFYLTNVESYAFCNIFDFPGDVSIETGFQNIDLPLSWGEREEPSGNKWESQKPIFDSYDDIANYELNSPNNSEYKFEYWTIFEGKLSDPGFPVSCSYDLFPDGINPPGGDGYQEIPTYDLGDLNTQFTNYENSILNLQNQLTGNAATDETLLESINLLEARRDRVVGWALSTLSETYAAQEYSTWLGRANTKISSIDQIMSDISADQWSSLYTYLGTISTNSVDDADDLSNLSSAVQYLQTLDQSGADLYALDEADLLTLESFLYASLGDFTATLRAWICAHYDRCREYTNQNSNNSLQNSTSGLVGSQGDEQSVEDFTTESIVFPNPSDGCITFKFQTVDKYDVEAIDLSGRIIKRVLAFNGSKLCLDDITSEHAMVLIKYSNHAKTDHGIIRLILNK